MMHSYTRLFALSLFVLAGCSQLSLNDDTDTDGNSDAGMKIDALHEKEQWTWVDLPNSKCADGSSTGFGLNTSDASDEVFVYFQGGGACWDAQTCFALKTAANITGYGATQFETEPAIEALLFDRDDAENPFRTMSYVFIPYCTGDLHNGTLERTYGGKKFYHWGANNVSELLPTLATLFGDAPKVLVAGSSAGGYGAQFNFDRFVETFNTAEVHLFSDSGPLISAKGTRGGLWEERWGARVPEGCNDSCGTFSLRAKHLHETYPKHRFALATYAYDNVLNLYFDYINLGAFFDQQEAFLESRYNEPNTAYYRFNATGHTFFSRPRNFKVKEISLLEWIRAWKDGSPSWETLR